MGVEIKLTDKDLPVSPVFIDFLHRYIEEKDFEVSWHDQLSEVLIPAKAEETLKAAVSVADQVLQHPIGQEAIYRSYELLTAFLTGQVEKLRSFHERYRFICVVGCPRHGGSYLTKHLFLALGMDPRRVPNVLAHDGFPDAGPFCFAERHNSLTAMMQNMAEYLAMMEVFFAKSGRLDDLVVVPKKATKAVYHGAFFHTAFGPRTEYVVTLCHPLAACISTYEKSTGLPADGKFKVRSNIEEWARRDIEFTGADPTKLFDWTVVVCGRERMMGLAQDYYRRFGNKEEVEDFKVFDRRGLHKELQRAAEAAIHRVTETWKTVGLAFPVEEIMEGW